MYVQRTTYSAAVGKGEELRRLLQEAVIGYQADGIRIGLGREVFGVAGEITTIVLANTLAELQETRERILAGAGYRARVAQSIALLAAQPVSTLSEPIVPFPQDGNVPKYTQRVVLTPAVGKFNDLRRITEERVLARRAQMRISLAQTVFGTGQAIIVNIGLADFAAVEALRELNRTDSEFIAYQEQLQLLLARTAEISLHEVLVPVQPAAIREMAGAATR